jgi:hypothetical protein
MSRSLIASYPTFPPVAPITSGRRGKAAPGGGAQGNMGVYGESDLVLQRPIQVARRRPAGGGGPRVAMGGEVGGG